MRQTSRVVHLRINMRRLFRGGACGRQDKVARHRSGHEAGSFIGLPYRRGGSTGAFEHPCQQNHEHEAHEIAHEPPRVQRTASMNDEQITRANIGVDLVVRPPPAGRREQEK